MWQKCPICNGSGTIPNEFNNSGAWSPFVTCTTCNGEKIISSLHGLPPSKYNPIQKEDDFKKFNPIELDNLQNPK
jgi:hypothetical protein